ncbi:MAG TPA: NAD(P)/FAD-dependent oxidoreductase [Vicinamibacteria bacterium]|nr:NAD(P)/FAD-dependent oxidoreductase [Vicinamibacteria bacterium]
MSSQPSPEPHVVIVGGGFAGLTAARTLRHAPVRVTLVDRHNHHTFQPLLYQVATAGLSSTNIAAPLRHILRRQRNVTVVLADATGVDLGRRRLVLRDGEMPYDFLILAAGATHSYFGHEEWSRFAPGLKTLDDAIDIRRRVLLAFEEAERETDEARRAEWLTFVVVGAGPTGVEMAGTLAEIARHTLRGEFRHIDPARARVILVEGTDRVLPPYAPRLSEKARRQLEHLGVVVFTSRMVTGVDATGVWLGEERIAARTVVWAAGVAASPLGRSLGVPVDRAGRVKVAPDLTVPGHKEVFVTGDLALVEEGGRAVPGVAPAANQMGRHAARNVLRALEGQPLAAFHYVDKGSLATIGRRAGVADFGRFQLWGAPAWLAWLAIHIFFLIGFRNRLIVMFDWALAYLTYQRHARLLLGPLPPLRSAEAEESRAEALTHSSH